MQLPIAWFDIAQQIVLSKSLLKSKFKDGVLHEPFSLIQFVHSNRQNKTPFKFTLVINIMHSCTFSLSVKHSPDEMYLRILDDASCAIPRPFACDTLFSFPLKRWLFTHNNCIHTESLLPWSTYLEVFLLIMFCTTFCVPAALYYCTPSNMRYCLCNGNEVCKNIPSPNSSVNYAKVCTSFENEFTLSRVYSG